MSDHHQPYSSEALSARVRRYVLASAYALRPRRSHLLPRLGRLTCEWLFQPERARRRLARAEPRDTHELVAVVDDLSVETMIAGFRSGSYPLAHAYPMKWWAPDMRAVIDPTNAHIDKNTRRILRQGKWRFSFDRDFIGVLQGCADPEIRKVPLTWLSPRMQQAFFKLHEAGYAHSVEVRDEAGELIGGLFGVTVGGVFFGQSQFMRQRDASKAAVAVLHRHLAHWGFKVRDGQRMTSHLASLGFSSMPRAEFEALIQQNVDRDLKAPWSFDPNLDIANWDRADAEPAASA